MNSLWLIIVSLAAFAVAYRLYGAFLAAKVAVLNDARLTPAHRLKDGVDYHPTNKLVLFGHHFAAIAGPGPLIGPVLAAQWGFLPGFSWIVVGACLAGGVHDFVILWASVREDGLTLAKIVRRTTGPVSGLIASIATLFIIVVTLASVAIVVVTALGESPWGMFTILSTIPAALVTGLWMYKVRPGKVAEASVIGVAMVLAGVFLGKPFAESGMGHYLLLSGKTLSILLPVYACIASILPVWVLMCPRDYLSCYMKIGVMAVLAVGIVIAHPTLKMPATTPFLSNGPVVPGAVWPFVCITIMCGAISGFHALIASGTTPKMVYKESDIRPIGYGAMVVEGFVAIAALVAACALEPGDYFALNIPQNTPAQVSEYQVVVDRAGQNGWDLRAKELAQLEEGTKEGPRPDATGKMVGGLRGKTGGAVTLAVGMAKVFARLPGMSTLMSYWYHFVIMFEAFFILTLLETGTRVARFVFQEAMAAEEEPTFFAPLIGWGWRGLEYALWVLSLWLIHPAVLDLADQWAAARGWNWWPSRLPMQCVFVVASCVLAALVLRVSLRVRLSVLVCFLWGYLLYTGNIQTLWRMLGIANQLLACIALTVGTTYLLLHARKRVYALCTGVPFVFIFVTVVTASVQSIRGWWLAAGKTEGPAAFQLTLMSVLGSIMLGLTVIIAGDAVRRWRQILRSPAEPAAADLAVGQAK